MHELYKLEKTALDGYQTYNFAKGNFLVLVISGSTCAD